MAKYFFPAIFTKEDSVYTVRFPDLEHCYTQGDSISDAIEMAEDVLCLTLYGMEEHSAAIPAPSDVHDLDAGENGFVSLVTCDTLEYRKLYDQRAVKKTLTIPAWLNTMSEKQGVNFSAVLQSALKRELHLSDQ